MLAVKTPHAKNGMWGTHGQYRCSVISKSGHYPSSTQAASSAEEFAQEHVEMVDTVFAFDGVAAAIVGDGL